MRQRQASRLAIALLAVICLCFVVIPRHQSVMAGAIAEENSFTAQQSEILKKLSKADVVYLGETHDLLEDHEAQLKIIQALYKKRGIKIAIAMEMFQRPYQQVLDRYVKGEISEEELLKETEYEERWGFPWEYYQAIAQYAQKHRLPIIAMNTPTEVSRKVARQGWESLTPEETKYIPPEKDIDLSNKEYRARIEKVYQEHAAHSQGNSSSFDRFFLTQVLWDETMAESIAKFVKDNPKTQVVVLVGQGHVAYGYGIPSRVERRLKNVTQASLVFQGESEIESEKVAAFVWKH